MMSGGNITAGLLGETYMANKKYKQAKNKNLRIQNNDIYRYYYDRIISAALAQFEWHGLPNTTDMLYFERQLLFTGQAAVYNVTGTDTWLSTGFVQKSQFNVYGYPSAIDGVGYNNANIPVDNFCVCYDNVLKDRILPKIDLYARLLYEVHNTFRSNLRQQNTPYIVKTNRNTLLTVRNFFNNLFGFDPVIEVRESFDTQSMEALDLRVDFKGKDLLDCLKVIWAEAMSMLGITEETTKKERMLNNEITLNRMGDVISLHTRMMPRLDFCHRMNDLTGWDVSVNLTAQQFDLAPYDAAPAELSNIKDDDYDPESDDVGGDQ